MTNRLPEKLSALRKHFGYSQGDMAERLSVPVVEYMNWENGNTICRIDQLRILSNLFKVPIEDLADNTRAVTLPRLDEDDDSIQIAFTGGHSEPVVEQASEELETDVTEDLIAGSVLISSHEDTDVEEPLTEPTRILDTAELQKTAVIQIEEDPDEEDEPEEEIESTGSRWNPKLIGIILGIAALLVAIVVAGTRLFGKRAEQTTVSLSDTNRLALGGTFSLYLSSEGNLVKAGQAIPAIDDTDLVQISAGTNWALGLKNDGTVVCAGANNACLVDEWNDIVMIAAGESHSVGLKSDGTVECNGSSGACSVSDWTDVSAVYAGNEITVGVTTSGELLLSGNVSSAERLRSLTGVKSVDLGSNQVIVTFLDGTVGCYAIGSSSTSNTGAWSNMDAAVTGGNFAAGLSGGKVTIASTDDSLVKAVADWHDIQYIAARNNTLIAVNGKGTVIGIGDNSTGVYSENDDEALPEETETTEETLKQVSNVQFKVTSANLQITWDAVADADFYTVKVNTSPETSLKTEKPSVSVSTDKLRSGQNYVITITACAKENSEFKDSTALIMNYQFEANLTKLSMPSNITCNQDGTDMVIRWDAVNNADHYEVTVQEMSKTVTDTSVRLDMKDWSSSTFTVYVTAYPKESDTRYTYSDTATGTGKYEVQKTDLAKSSITERIPGENGELRLAWSAVENAGGYTVSIGNQSIDTPGTSYVFTGLSAGDYELRVTANPSDTSRYNSSTYTETYSYKPVEPPAPQVPEPSNPPEESSEPTNESEEQTSED